ncbi:MAG: AAA family ATPase [archaeon]|jgi:hypothetical protein
MNEIIFSKILLESQNKKRAIKEYPKKRYLYDNLINSKSNYFIGISGLRGIGKTILLLQLFDKCSDAIYFSADSIYLSKYTLYDILKFLIKKGYKNIFIDEITYKDNWQQNLKTIYDEEKIKVYFTSSSSLNILKGVDLSRRVLLSELKPASLREYINIMYDQNIQPIKLEELLDTKKRKEVLNKYISYFDYYEGYYKFGGFLYNKDKDLSEFYKSIDSIFKKIIYSDISNIRSINPKVETDIYNILYLLSTTTPFEMNYSKLSKSINGVSRNTLIAIINDLEKINIIKQLRPCNSGYPLIRTDPKIFLNLPFRYFFNNTLSKTPNIGALREDFFVYSASPDCYVKTGKAKSADFMINNKIYEIGGESKKNNQNADYLVVDSLACENNKIPLFLFGFLY